MKRFKVTALLISIFFVINFNGGIRLIPVDIP